MHGLAALCHEARKGGDNGSRSTYTWRASSLLGVYRGNSLIAKPDCQLRVYVAYEPDSTANPKRYEGLAEVEHPPNVHPVRRLMPDLEARPQRNLGFDPVGVFFDVVSPLFPTLRFSVPSGTTPPLDDVFQRLYWSDSTSHFEDRLAGQVEFHPAHGHYHFSSFGLSRLWSSDETR